MFKWVQPKLNCVLSGAFQHGSELFIYFLPPLIERFSLHKWDFLLIFIIIFIPDIPFGSWQYLLSITSLGYVVTRFDDEYSKWRILCESAIDVKYKNEVKYKNDVKYIKKIVSCVHERIAKRKKMECRDGPKEGRYKTVK